MGQFKKGNKVAKGNKGGGRKSAYEEFLDAQWHKGVWDNPTALEELGKKIASGVYSVRDIFLYKALAGKSDRVLGIFANKILPDISMMISPTGNDVQINLVGEAEKRAKKYEDDDE